MIFDDDTDLLEVCTIVLRSKQFEVVGRNRCTDIIEQVSAYQPDVILMDNWIPEIGGVKATQLLKQEARWRHIPVIFFSANSNVDELAAEAGAEMYLQKPFEIDDLENTVTRAIALKSAV